MLWVLGTVLAGSVGAGALALRVRSGRRVLAEIGTLSTQGRHGQVIAHPLPARPWREEARLLQATSAVTSGRFRLALELLADAADDGAAVPPGGTTATLVPVVLRARTLLGLGRYDEVVRLLGNRPPHDALARLRAEAAIEMGDDDLAQTLLADAATDPIDEAARLHLLGGLHLRGTRDAEGERMVRTARATFAGTPDHVFRADAAVCTTTLARARLDRGRAVQALPLVRSALDGLAVRPDDAPRLAAAHALAARVYSVLRMDDEAVRELTAAREQATRCESPRLDAEVLRARALVAFDLGDLDGARHLLTEALAAHQRLGARAMVAELRANLATLPQPASEEPTGP